MDDLANQNAVDNPEPGDYWHEMFCPYFMVVKVDGDDITILSCMDRNDPLHYAKVDNKDGTWSFDYAKHMVVDKDWIQDKVTYKSIPGFVATVSKGHDKLVDEWKEFHRERLQTELEKFA